METIKLLSVGDATLDVFVTPKESETLCEIDDKECLVCFSYGDKIPVKNLHFSIGGNAANNAIGATRLGVPTSTLLTLGDDDIGGQIVEKLIKEKVDTSYIFRQKNSNSNYNTIIVVAGERTIFSFKPQREQHIPESLPETEWIYLTSMGDAFEEMYSFVAGHVKAHSETKLAFNPGSRQIRAGVDKLKNILAVSHVVYVNRQEAEILTGMSQTQSKEKELLKALSELGPKISIITDGGNGAFVFDGEKYIQSGVLPVDAYERTGAGDAFGSGCISALIHGKSLEEALLWGTVNSASVIGYTGAQQGLLTAESMPIWIDRAYSSEVKVRKF